MYLLVDFFVRNILGQKGNWYKDVENIVPDLKNLPHKGDVFTNIEQA